MHASGSSNIFFKMGNLFILFTYLFIYLFIYLLSRFFLSRSTLNCFTFHASYQPSVSTKMSPPLTTLPTRPLGILRPPVSWGLAASSLSEPRPVSPLLYMCLGPPINWCMLPGWCSSVWEISGVQVNWNCWLSNFLYWLRDKESDS